jgi:hypothetical protein
VDNQTIELWKQARRIDPTLRISSRQYAELNRRRVRPVTFSRDRLFASMAEGTPVVFSNVLMPVRGEGEFGLRQAVFESLRSGLPKYKTYRVRLGRDGDRLESLRADQLLRRWSSGRSLVSITDLDIRESNLLNYIDCSALSDFNLLAGARKPVAAEEMLTMVVSSAGVFTDSHSDVPDGSNHCFFGKKLWLVWDTFEGIARNLEDHERSGSKRERAAFSISAFLSIPGARWLTVEEGQTLFLPGHLTHKVVTLEDYIGIGSFFVMLPSYLRTLIRWTEHTPLWALDARSDRRMALVDKITRRVTRKVKSLAKALDREQAQWGLPYLVSAVTEWQRVSGPHSPLFDNPDSSRLLKTVQNLRDPADALVFPTRRTSTRRATCVNVLIP